MRERESPPLSLSATRMRAPIFVNKDEDRMANRGEGREEGGERVSKWAKASNSVVFGGKEEESDGD